MDINKEREAFEQHLLIQDLLSLQAMVLRLMSVIAHILKQAFDKEV